MKAGSNVILAVAFATSPVKGCPLLDMTRQLREEGHGGEDMTRELWGSFGGLFGAHPRVQSRNLVSCTPGGVKSSCYGSLFPELSPLNHSWFDLLQIGLPGPDNDGTPSYMLEDFFPTTGEQQRTMGEVSETGNVPPTLWPEFDDFLVRPGVGLAGYTYLGQLFSHDINSDKNTKLGDVVNPNDVFSSVSASADLDTMYGSMTKGKFSMVEVFRNGEVVGYDFPRDKQTGTADTHDDRNDNTMVIAQTLILFQMYHNKVFDEYKSSKACFGNKKCFDMARKETVKTYQSIVAHDLLPNLISTELYNFMKSDGGLATYVPLFYKPGTQAYDEQRTPTEFSTCAYRVFHSRLAGAYRWGSPAPFTGLASTFGEPTSVDASLIGGRHADPQLLPFPWYRFFDLSSLNEEFPSSFTGHLLDSLYVDQLIKSPLGVPGNPKTPIELHCTEDVCKDDCNGDQCFIVDEGVDPRIVDPNWGVTASLASIDFLRGQTLGLPGGFAMNEFARNVVQGTGAGYPKISKLKMQDIKESKNQPFGLPAAWASNSYDEIPCMLYMFMESILQKDPTLGPASRMGALGSYIVGETTLGFIRHAEGNIFDDLEFRSMANEKYEVNMTDLIEYVGATPQF